MTLGRSLGSLEMTIYIVEDATMPWIGKASQSVECRNDAQGLGDENQPTPEVRDWAAKAVGGSSWGLRICGERYKTQRRTERKKQRAYASAGTISIPVHLSVPPRDQSRRSVSGVSGCYLAHFRLVCI